ncbi:hypothetical protein BH10PSE13_BH10PSE13_20330 [soil metagenome]
MIEDRRSDERSQSAFAFYLRTGRRLGLEVKFNPWHDPEDGRFTFAGSGSYSSGSEPQQPNAGMARAPQDARGRMPPGHGATARQSPCRRFDPRHPTNHSVYVAQPGDSLTRIASKRRGLTPSNLAWLNRLQADARLKPGQRLIVPTQAYLEVGKAARTNFMNIAFYMDTHGGKLPPDLAHVPSVQSQLDSEIKTTTANGYHYDIDTIQRSRKIYGELDTSRPERRSKTLQRQAGGAERRPTDDGGHFIAARFGGPRKWFNHFAQDASFNRGRYNSLEKSWARSEQTGHPVSITIVPHYRGVSIRPYALTVEWTIDGKTSETRFANERKGKKDDR